MKDLKTLTDNGWTRIDAAIHGEFYLGILLRMHGQSEAASRRNCKGWDGDIYHAYRHTDGQVAMALATTWDDASSAQRFAKAYVSILPAKLGVDKLDVLKSAGDGFDVTYSCGESGGTGRVVLRDRELFVVEGADRDTVDAVVQEMRAIKIKHVE
jgi:hypothetical protein